MMDHHSEVVYLMAVADDILFDLIGKSSIMMSADDCDPQPGPVDMWPSSEAGLLPVILMVIYLVVMV
jgi:hypothetical protein